MTANKIFICQYFELLLNNCIKCNVKVIIKNDILSRIISTLGLRVLINISVTFIVRYCQIRRCHAPFHLAHLRS